MCRSLATSASKGRLSLFASSDTVINQFLGRCDERAGSGLGAWETPMWWPQLGGARFGGRLPRVSGKIDNAHPMRHAGTGLCPTDTGFRDALNLATICVKSGIIDICARKQHDQSESVGGPRTPSAS